MPGDEHPAPVQRKEFRRRHPSAARRHGRTARGPVGESPPAMMSESTRTTRGFRVGQPRVLGPPARWGRHRVGGTSLSSPLLAGVVAVADQFAGHPLGFVNPLYYHLLGTRALHDIVAPASPLAEVRTDYVNFLDDSQGRFFRLRTIDVQTSTLHATPGYDDETGVGSPNGPRFFLGTRIGGHRRH